MSFRLNETCPGKNREPESSSSRIKHFWTPAFAGVTIFYETTNILSLRFLRETLYGTCPLGRTIITEQGALWAILLATLPKRTRPMPEAP